MNRWLGLAAVAAAGCGPTAGELRERTLSALHVEAERWDGGDAFTPAGADAYGRPLTARVEAGTLDHVLEVRSAGPDGLPGNSDDLTATRRRRHGRTTVTQEAAKAAEAVTGGAASGAVQGVRKGLGLGGPDR